MLSILSMNKLGFFVAGPPLVVFISFLYSVKVDLALDYKLIKKPFYVMKEKYANAVINMEKARMWSEITTYVPKSIIWVLHQEH
jgi:hypothetical protein